MREHLGKVRTAHGQLQFSHFYNRHLNTIKKFRYCFNPKDEGSCSEVNTDAIINTALGQIACSVWGEDVGYTPTGKIPRGNEDTEIAIEATVREKLYFRGSLNNHSRVLEEIAH